MSSKEVFCPVCKIKNFQSAVNCAHCGAPLAHHPAGSPKTTKSFDVPKEIAEKFTDLLIDNSSIPADGIAVYTVDTTQPIYLNFDKELILGRMGDDESDESTLDLTQLGGYQMGISRPHAMIRRLETGYELLDLFSTNGSWLDEERLVPNKPYPLPSGSQMRFGLMRLLILYRSVTGK